MLPTQQIHRERRDAWAVTSRGNRLSRERRAGDRTAATLALLRVVLDRDQLDHRQVEDLTRLYTDHGRVREVSTAPVAANQSMGPDLIRNCPRLQPEPLPALRLAGLATRRLPKRLRCWLAQPIAARWLGGVPGVPPQPRFQLRDPIRQRRDQRITLGKHDQQLLNGGSRWCQRRVNLDPVVPLGL